MTQHIVNVSGGKDSTACYLLALQSGRPFRAVMADTGNEHQITMDYAQGLAAKTGGPEVEVFRADFSERIAKKRRYVAEKWPLKGVPCATIDRALEVLQPTGNPFLDLCIWKGRFPSRRAQFCTEFLKSEAIQQKVIDVTRKSATVIQWLGVRRDESIARRHSPMWQTVRTPGQHVMRFYRPLIHWTAENVFSFAAHHGVDPNPLYLEGMGRVGCFPCINASKAELRAIWRRYPDAFERIEDWEDIVADASKRGAATFFAADVTPEGARMARAGISGARGGPQYPRAKQVAAWAQTDRGGRQHSWLIDAEDDGVSCTSQYGLCE
ncbi:phosphoadenosine phosphosulfate reductase family protein [Paracoccus homiensis]|uniref:3'-phosphoadenosine 5'-phosphosulfate sulfotransferase (PAPS reductase)/FAD synthetase n=1 Tax=Paracoccus homiensis TaxID=364199 RepID=A0A1I0GWS6_9RHOB|nr:phosphoadenosine phosphosulfate reductase family protein [Paracoccus homiensis]SET75626.1 3'-phosphoadenosine 5'-phosphosulfate sulfotransferase (PAPS reductase)/FAD synthetase [Paracoccus homiensis]